MLARNLGKPKNSLCGNVRLEIHNVCRIANASPSTDPKIESMLHAMGSTVVMVPTFTQSD
jgi:hypothetical protein